MADTMSSHHPTTGNTNPIKVDNCLVEMPTDPVDAFNFIRSLVIASYRAVTSGTSTPDESAVIFGTARGTNDRSDGANLVDVVPERPEEGSNAKTKREPTATTKPTPDDAPNIADATYLSPDLTLWDLAIAVDTEFPVGAVIGRCGLIGLHARSTLKDVAVAVGTAAGRGVQPSPSGRLRLDPNGTYLGNFSGIAEAVEKRRLSEAWVKGAYIDGWMRLGGRLARTVTVSKLSRCKRCIESRTDVACRFLVGGGDEYVTTTSCGRCLRFGGHCWIGGASK